MNASSPPAATGTATPATPGAAAVAPRSGRLRSGELRRQVAQYLADHAGREFTACELANVLSRSSGAVGNALGVLAGRGEAERATVTPVRYRATATTAAAAAAVTVSPRRPRSARPATTPASAAAPISPAETEVGRERRCGMCGTALGYWIAFLGGPPQPGTAATSTHPRTQRARSRRFRCAHTSPSATRTAPPRTACTPTPRPRSGSPKTNPTSG